MLKQEVIDQLTVLMKPMRGKRMLEIGTGWGESAEFFGKLKPGWIIYTIDGFGLYGDGRIYNQFDHETVKKINYSLGSNVIQILGNSQTIPWELSIDVLFIDGDHTREGCLSDYTRFSPFIKKNGLLVFDDYTQENNPNNGVKSVVDQVPADDFKLIHLGYYAAIFQKL